MANLIIKSSADNLVLQGSDASPAITVGATGTTTFAENATLSGTANTLGTASGILTLNDGSVLNHDAQKNAWHLYRSASNNMTSAAVLNFDATEFIGSNVSASSGEITVTDAGLYFVSYCVSCYAENNTNIDFNLRVNDTQVDGSRVYIASSAGQASYVGESWSGAVRVAAGQTIHAYGTGYFFGAGADSMTSFKGCRIGALS